MTKIINNSDLICSLCGNIYTNPILLSPCGHSFDRECILQYSTCPIVPCNAPVFENSLLSNIKLKNLIDHQIQTTKYTYEIFLLDTSSSMWYSDWYISLFGVSRFQTAIQFLKDVFLKRWNSTTHQISLVTFDTNPIERFAFETARQEHIDMLDELRPNGKHTALFDAIRFGLEKFENLNQITLRSTAQCLYILTDGGDDFSSSGNQQQFINFVKNCTKQLEISGHIIQIGDRNLSSIKQFSDKIDYHFHHFNNGNAREFLNSFLLSSSQSTQNSDEILQALPDPCNESVRSKVIRNRTLVSE
ncbi:hypothetical protein I4U23_030731 [Adineta vaga]|nr:hypothetical protein I4U23_030731 [Adineta vaga]